MKWVRVSFPSDLQSPLLRGPGRQSEIAYQGGFDRDRFSRMYTRDENGAYIGMEGTYLMYSAKWFPVNRFLVDRATATVEVTVPLGMTVIGPGMQLPVVTKGITETFGWAAKVPILPGSIVAGQYFRKKVQAGDFTIECFGKDSKHLDGMQKDAEAAAKILEFYQKMYGPSASGSNYRLVEVDEQLAKQPGMLGTIFITPGNWPNQHRRFVISRVGSHTSGGKRRLEFRARMICGS